MDQQRTTGDNKTDASSSGHKWNFSTQVVISITAVAVALISSGAWFIQKNKPDPTAPAVRPLTVDLHSGDGLLPAWKNSLTVPDANAASDQTLWAAVQNDREAEWHLFPCGPATGEGRCEGVAVGPPPANPTSYSLGPWRIAALLVNDKGRQMILGEHSNHRGDLKDWLKDNLVAYGVARAYRTPPPSPS